MENKYSRKEVDVLDRLAGELFSDFDIRKEGGKRVRAAQDYISQGGFEGILVPVSGGLDSTVVTSILARTGIDLTFLYLPSDATSAETEPVVREVVEYAEGLCRERGARCSFIEHPIGKELAENPEYLSSRQQQEGYVTRYGMGPNGSNDPMALQVLRRDFGEEGGKATAFIGMTTRMRRKHAERVARENNLAPASCGNRTEHRLNLYFPGAVDDMGDFRLIEDLYKTQARLIGLGLGMPESVRHRASSPDIGKGAGTGEEYFGAPYVLMDYVLTRIDAGESEEQVVQRIRPFYGSCLKGAVDALRGQDTPLEKIVADIFEMERYSQGVDYEGRKK